jgi:hypothetical protein
MVTNGTATIIWSTMAGRTYTLQRKDALADANWTNVVSGVTGSGAAAMATDSVGLSSQRFYRVVTQ